jgi:hypothetical protein
MPDNYVFIPFEELTEEEVINWIQAVVTGGYEEHVNNLIQKQIDDKKNPVVEASLPWASNTQSNTAPL